MRRALWLLAFAGCVDTDLAGVDRAVVVHLVDVDEQGSGHYEVAEHQLPELADLATLRGRRIAFAGRPTLDFGDLEADSILCPRVDITTSSLDLRVAVEDGVAIARDERSLAMLSAYHELTLVLERAEEVTGVTAEQFRDGPMPVNFEVTLLVDDARQDGKTNAFYESCTDSFGLLRPSAAEAIRLAYDAQVLSHELGHAFFERTFHAADGECDPHAPGFPGRFATEEDIAGLNEGFADFFAFVLVGAVAPLNDPLGINEFSGERAISPTVPNYVPFSGLAPECDQEFYCIGTELARSLYDAFVADGHDPRDPAARAELGREVLAALPQLPAAMRSYTADLPLADPSLDQLECRRAKFGGSIPQFLRALLEHLPATRLPALCAAMGRHFAERFTNVGQGVCP